MEDGRPARLPLSPTLKKAQAGPETIPGSGFRVLGRDFEDRKSGSGSVEFLPSQDGVILSSRRIWRAADMNPDGNCGRTRKILQD
jgi:hypothetical protein